MCLLLWDISGQRLRWDSRDSREGGGGLSQFVECVEVRSPALNQTCTGLEDAEHVDFARLELCFQPLQLNRQRGVVRGRRVLNELSGSFVAVDRGTSFEFGSRLQLLPGDRLLMQLLAALPQQRSAAVDDGQIHLGSKADERGAEIIFEIVGPDLQIGGARGTGQVAVGSRRVESGAGREDVGATGRQRGDNVVWIGRL